MCITYTILLWTGIEPFFSFLVGAVILFILGYLLQRTAINQILGFPEVMQVFPMIGMGTVFEILSRRDKSTQSQQRNSGL